jgi:hypothetical protein
MPVFVFFILFLLFWQVFLFNLIIFGEFHFWFCRFEFLFLTFLFYTLNQLDFNFYFTKYYFDFLDNCHQNQLSQFSVTKLNIFLYIPIFIICIHLNSIKVFYSNSSNSHFQIKLIQFAFLQTHLQ